MRYQNRKPLRIRTVIPESNARSEITRPTDTIASVGETEYIKSLKANIIKRQKYIKAAEKNKIETSNPLITEILWQINQRGEITEEGLSRDLQFTHKVIHNINNFLLRNKLIKRKKNKRGNWLYIKLT